MNDQFISLSSWPRAIMHIDADAFFASCEQAIHPELKGRPVITGKERGIVAAASYEAKARGVAARGAALGREEDLPRRRHPPVGLRDLQPFLGPDVRDPEALLAGR